MTVTLPNGVEWINECYRHDEYDEHVAVYLIPHGDQHILVDSGSFHHREEIKEEIRDVVGDDGLDAIVLSHSDYPHSANVSEFRSEWGDVELIASSGAPEYQGLSDARHCEIGSTMEILGRTFSFIDPPLADRSHTTWIHDHESGTLFTADGFGSVHHDGQCAHTSGEFEEGIPRERIYEYHRTNLVWLQYVDPEKLERALRSILDGYDVECIAPIHGHPILGDDVPGYLDDLIESADRIASEYTVSETPI